MRQRKQRTLRPISPVSSHPAFDTWCTRYFSPVQKLVSQLWGGGGGLLRFEEEVFPMSSLVWTLDPCRWCFLCEVCREPWGGGVLPEKVHHWRRSCGFTACPTSRSHCLLSVDAMWPSVLLLTPPWLPHQGGLYISLHCFLLGILSQ